MWKNIKTTQVPIRKKAVSLSTTHPQTKYSEKDYEISNSVKYDFVCAQERLAERMIDESIQVLENVDHTTSTWQREVDHYIRDRVEEVKFMCEELKKQRRLASKEDEALSACLSRMKNALILIKRAIAMTKQCIGFREQRIGVELCVDEVEKQLLHELVTMKGAEALLDKTSAETTKQLRSLREAIFTLDEDVKEKESAMRIDTLNLQLRKTANLKQGLDLAAAACKYTLEEWQEMSAVNIKNNSKEVISATSLRAYVDIILTQVYEDLRNKIDSTNLAFKRRIEETRKFKDMLTERHNKCTKNIIQIVDIIKNVEEQLADNQRSLALCQTRLRNRGRRSGQELTCDLGQEALYREQNTLQASLCLLKQKFDENSGVLRYLKHTCVLEEEEMNWKANTLHIDEVECMSLRQTLTFDQF